MMLRSISLVLLASICFVSMATHLELVAQFRPGNPGAGAPQPGGNYGRGGNAVQGPSSKPNLNGQRNQMNRNPNMGVGRPNNPGANGGVPGRGRGGSMGPSVGPSNTIQRQGMVVANPWSNNSNVRQIHNAPNGLNPHSNPLFPRPAVAVPTTIPNAYLGTTPQSRSAWDGFSIGNSNGNVGQMQQLVEQRLQGNRDLSNLVGAVGVLQATPNSGKLMSQYRNEALAVAQSQINVGPSNSLPYAVVAKFSLESGNQNAFRNATQQMVRSFPNDKHTQLYNGIQQLQDHNYADAEKALRRAKELGVPAESLNELLKLAIDGQRWVWEYAQVVFAVITIWLLGLGMIYSIGQILSSKVKKSATLVTVVKSTSPTEYILRFIYRMTINVAGVYYYLSLPVLVAASIALPLAVSYALLALPTFSLFLIAIVLIASITGIITAVSGVRTAFSRINDLEDFGKAILPVDAPKLWEITRLVAKEVKTRPIDEIWLTPGAEVAVIEKGSFIALMRDKGKRVLILGAAVLHDFRELPFRCVLAHEYGHFSNRDTAGGVVAMRVKYSMNAFANQIMRRGKVRKWDIAIHFLKFYGRLFSRMTFGASRLQEILADRVAVSIYGATAFRDGLTHAIQRSLEFDVQCDRTLWERIRDPGSQIGFYQSSQKFDIEVQDQILYVLQRIIDSASTDEDTHPSPLERFALADRIESSCEFADSRGDVSVWQWFADPNAIQSQLTRQLAEVVEMQSTRTRVRAEALLKHLSQLLAQKIQPELLFQRFEVYWEIGNYGAARQDLDRLIQLAPNLVVAHIAHSHVAEQQEDWHAAIRSSLTALNLDATLKDDFEFQVRHAKLHLRMRNFDDAIKTLDSAVAKQPDHVTPWLLRGRAYRELGNLNLALESYQHARRLHPGSLEAGQAIVEIENAEGFVAIPPIIEKVKNRETSLSKPIDKQQSTHSVEKHRTSERKFGTSHAEDEGTKSRNWVFVTLAGSAVAILVSVLGAITLLNHPQATVASENEGSGVVEQQIEDPKDTIEIDRQARERDQAARDQAAKEKIELDRLNQQATENLRLREIEERKERERIANEDAERQTYVQQIQLNLRALISAYSKQATGYSNDPLIKSDLAPTGLSGEQLSWRVHLLPALGLPDLYKKFHLDEPWDSSHNKLLLSQMPEVFQSYNNSKEMTCFRSPLLLDGTKSSQLTYSDLLDGTEQTSMFFFVNEQMAIPWTKPDSLEPFPDSLKCAQIGSKRFGLQMICIEPNKESLSVLTDDLLLKAYASPAGGELVVHSRRALSCLMPHQNFMPINSDLLNDKVSSQLVEQKMQSIAAALSKIAMSKQALPWRKLPDALSWRVDLLPMLGYQSLYNEFKLDEPWNSSNNLKLIGKMPDEFRMQSSMFRTQFRMISATNGERFFIDPQSRNTADATALVFFVANHRSLPWTANDTEETSYDQIPSHLGLTRNENCVAAITTGEVAHIPLNLHRARWSELLRSNRKFSYSLSDFLSDPSRPLKRNLKLNPPGQIAERLELPFAARPNRELVDEAAEPQFDQSYRRVVFSVVSYYDKNRTQPNHVQVNGKPSGLSWRVHVLPYIEEGNLYSQFDLNEPWDSEKNKLLIPFMPESLRGRYSRNDSSPYRMVEGSRFNFKDRDSFSRVAVIECDSTDSTSWTKPDDIQFDQQSDITNLTKSNSSRLLLWDGTLLELPTSYPSELWNLLLNGDSKYLVDTGTLNRHASFTLGKWVAPPMRENQWELTQLRTISQAFQNYESAFKRLPVRKFGETDPLNAFAEENLSWRVHILPYFGQQKLFDQFRLNEPWDSPHNIRLLKYMPDCFRSVDAQVDSTTTRVLVFTGPDTPFIEPGNSIRLRDFKDGTQNTILLFQAPPNLEVPWTQPADFDLNRIEELDLSSSIKIATANGNALILKSNISIETLRALVTPAGGELLRSDVWRSDTP